MTKELKEGERFFFSPPEWVRGIKDESVQATVFALLMSWSFEEPKHIGKNLKDYIKETFDDITDEQADEVARVLVEKGVVKLDEPSGK